MARPWSWTGDWPRSSATATIPTAPTRPCGRPRAATLRETSAGEQRGTPAYMSPEQARGEVERLGPATDIYSLGATLYYMLTGRAPFTGDDFVAILHEVTEGRFQAPRDANPRIDRALDAICRKAMSRNPEDRYASSRLLAADLELWLADMPVAAYAEPISRKAMRAAPPPPMGRRRRRRSGARRLGPDVHGLAPG